MRRLSMFLPPTLALALAGLPLGRHVVSRDVGVHCTLPAAPASASRRHSRRRLRRVARGIGIAAGICVAAIRRGAGAGWPAVQRQYGGGEIEEVLDQESVLIICNLLKS